MFNKQMIFNNTCAATVISLFLLTGCEGNKTKKIPEAKTKPKTENLFLNPSFEEGKSLKTGILKKSRKTLGRPVGWTTHNQALTTSLGWCSTEVHRGKRSLEILNLTGTRAYWKGEPVILKKTANSFQASIWTKTKDIKNDGILALSLDVYLKRKNGIVKVKKINIGIPKNDHDWKKTAKNFLFDGNIEKIVPFLYFSKMTGTVYFDDLELVTAEVLLKDKKNLFSSREKHLRCDSAINSADGEILIKGKHTATSDFIPFSPSKIYELSGTFKSNKKRNGYIIYGFITYDKNKKFINYIYMYADYISSEWLIFKGLLGKNYMHHHIIPENTKFIKILCFANLDNNKTMELYLKDIELNEYSFEISE